MSDISPNLKFPYLLSSQSQKHVTLNQSLSKIDGLLMLSITEKGLNAAPSNPLEGARYIIGTQATGAWAGKENQIGLYINLGWEFIQPTEGFLAFLKSEQRFLCFRNSGWADFAVGNGFFQNLNSIGIQTFSDANDPFSAKINSGLFCAKYSGDGGNGDIKLRLNKESNNDFASFIFQNNWSGRAEIGLCGDDNLSFKVSPNGTDWKTAISLDKSSGRANFIGLDLPSIASENNELIRLGSTRLFHAKKASGTYGNNLFIGVNAGNFTMAYSSNQSDASFNVAFGNTTLQALTIGSFNTVVGHEAMKAVTSGSQNCGFGAYSLDDVTTGSFNTAFGTSALGALTTGSSNSAIGVSALRYKVDGTDFVDLSNCTGLGLNSRASASNQVQLGGSGTTTYAYGAVQDRSDLRDKADIRDTILGLDFINSLRPVDFKWDMRDDYFEIDEGGEITPITKDGSKKRSRYHHGLIAQEVKAVCDSAGVDFGGYQDHSIIGGSDVLSIGYTELIAPLIKAVQELSERINQIEN